MKIRYSRRGMFGNTNCYNEKELGHSSTRLFGESNNYNKNEQNSEELLWH